MTTVRQSSSRAQHAARTRQALVDAALQLYSTQGYDETTTTEIAEAAGVSPRTFFRYFPTKESVLFFGENEFVHSFTGLFLAQPDEASELAAMRDAFVTLAPALLRIRDRITLYRRAVTSSITLRGRETLVHEENTAVIAAAIAQRRGLPVADQHCVSTASIGLLMVERALAVWMAEGSGAQLGDQILEQFQILQDFARD